MRKTDLQTLIGKKFGRWTIVSEAPQEKKRTRVNVVCDCGNTSVLAPSRLWAKGTNRTQSCGCLKRELQTKHGHSSHHHQSSTYRCWADMTNRCSNPNLVNYAHYGGRGISVCERWASFSNFLADMGEKPPRLTIERIDTSGNYSPENCRWATRQEQNRNKTTSHFITFNGRTQTLSEWAKEYGLMPGTLHGRLRMGWALEKALAHPLRAKRS